LYFGHSCNVIYALVQQASLLDGATTLSITTFSITALSIIGLFATLSIIGLFATLSINTQQNSIVMLNVVMLSVVAPA
jgi:hypothetical protein